MGYNPTLLAIFFTLAFLGAYALVRIVILKQPENCAQVTALREAGAL